MLSRVFLWFFGKSQSCFKTSKPTVQSVTYVFYRQVLYELVLHRRNATLKHRIAKGRNMIGLSETNQLVCLLTNLDYR